MRLKCKCDTGLFVIGQSLTEDSSFNQLIDEICLVSGLDRSKIVLKIGYPPKIISGEYIKDTGIKEGDRIIVEITKSNSTLETKVSSVVSPKKGEPESIVVRVCTLNNCVSLIFN